MFSIFFFPLWMFFFSSFTHRQAAAGETKLFVFPNIASVSERESAIFAGIEDMGSDGYYNHDIHVKGAHNRFFKMHYRGKHVAQNTFHNLEKHDDLVSYQCDHRSVILHYKSAAAARVALADIRASLENSQVEHTILTGRQLWACPNSMSTENGNTKGQGMRTLEGIRRVIGAELHFSNPSHVVVATVRGDITDVFEELELSGEATLLPGGKKTKAVVDAVEDEHVPPTRKRQKVKNAGARRLRTEKILNEDEHMTSVLDGLESDPREVEEHPVHVNSDIKKLVKSVKKKSKKTVKKVKKKVKKTAKKVKKTAKKTAKKVKKHVNKAVKAMKKTGKKVIKKTFKTLKQFKDPKFWLNTVASGNMLKIVMKMLPSLPVLYNKGAKHTLSPKWDFGFNYNKKTRNASKVLAIGSTGEIDSFPSGAAFTVYARSTIATNAKNNGGKEGKSAHTSTVSGYVYCINCFVTFEQNYFRWRLKLGGKKLGLVELVYGTTMNAMFEFMAQINVFFQFTFPIFKLPIPFASMPLGLVTLGFALTGDITVGLSFRTPLFYYKYNYVAREELGLEYSLVLGTWFKKRANTISQTSYGPIIYSRASVGFYLQPSVSLVFTDIAAVSGGVVPTLDFNIVPVDQSGATTSGTSTKSPRKNPNGRTTKKPNGANRVRTSMPPNKVRKPKTTSRKPNKDAGKKVKKSHSSSSDSHEHGSSSSGHHHHYSGDSRASKEMVEMVESDSQKKSKQCTIKFTITLKIPFVLGAYIGVIVKGWGVPLWSKKLTFDFIPIPPLYSTCISSKDYGFLKNKYNIEPMKAGSKKKPSSAILFRPLGEDSVSELGVSPQTLAPFFFVMFVVIAFVLYRMGLKMTTDSKGKGERVALSESKYGAILVNTNN